LLLPHVVDRWQAARGGSEDRTALAICRGEAVALGVLARAAAAQGDRAAGLVAKALLQGLGDAAVAALEAAARAAIEALAAGVSAPAG